MKISLIECNSKIKRFLSDIDELEKRLVIFEELTEETEEKINGLEMKIEEIGEDIEELS